MGRTYPDSKHRDALAVGQRYQDFVAVVLKERLGVSLHFYGTKREQYELGETIEGYEVKLDEWCCTTGRLSIEVGEKARKDIAAFTPSGIMRQDNTVYYVQGNWQRLWVFRKTMLRYIYKQQDYPIISDNPPTIQKFYLPIGEAYRFAEHIFDIPAKQQSLFGKELGQAVQQLGISNKGY